MQKTGFDETPEELMQNIPKDPLEDNDPLTTNLYVGNLAPQVSSLI